MNIKTYSFSAIFACAILMALGSSSASAAIDEALMYPGANCIKQAGGTPSVDTNGRLTNNTSSTMTVICPLYDQGTSFAGNIWVVDNSTSANVTCTSAARNPLSGSGNQTVSTAGNSSDAKQLTFTGPTVSGTFTYRFITCTLPPTTSIINYRGKAL